MIGSSDKVGGKSCEQRKQVQTSNDSAGNLTLSDDDLIRSFSTTLQPSCVQGLLDSQHLAPSACGTSNGIRPAASSPQCCVTGNHRASNKIVMTLGKVFKTILRKRLREISTFVETQLLGRTASRETHQDAGRSKAHQKPHVHLLHLRRVSTRRNVRESFTLLPKTAV